MFIYIAELVEYVPNLHINVPKGHLPLKYIVKHNGILNIVRKKSLIDKFITNRQVFSGET